MFRVTGEFSNRSPRKRRRQERDNQGDEADEAREAPDEAGWSGPPGRCHCPGDGEAGGGAHVAWGTVRSGAVRPAPPDLGTNSGGLLEPGEPEAVHPPRPRRGLGRQPVSRSGAARTGVPLSDEHGPATRRHHPHDSISTDALETERGIAHRRQATYPRLGETCGKLQSGRRRIRAWVEYGTGLGAWPS